MITLIEGLPDHVVGLVAKGQITRRDYLDVIIPTLKKALAEHDKVSVYYEIAPEFTGIDFGAGFEDFWIGMSNPMKWKRIALVSDISMMRKGAEFFSHLIPADIHTYALSDRDAAKAWVVG